jgi:microcystin-dependent protein
VSKLYGQRISELNEAPLITDESLLAIVSGGETKKISFSVIKQYMLDLAHPVKSYYASDDPTDPGTLFGGTWRRIQGRVLYGADSSHAAGTEFGSSTTKLSTANLPAHSHGLNEGSGSTGEAGSHNHGSSYRHTIMTSNLQEYANPAGWGIAYSNDMGRYIEPRPGAGGIYQLAGFDMSSGMASNGNHTHTIKTSGSATQNAGSGVAFNNIQPSRATYIWQRIA